MYDYPTTSTVVISKKHKPEGGGGTPLSPDPPLPPGAGSPPGTGTGLHPQTWARAHHQAQAWDLPPDMAWAYQLL